MTSPMKKVVVAGASGNIGAPLVENLHAAGFSVSALTRHGSSATFPAYVTALPVSYDSPGELTAALRGHDIVVSCVGSFALSVEPALVTAAAAAGVRHFLPAEYGADSLNKRVRAFPILQQKVEVQDLLVQKAAETGMTYTLLFSGLFLDWGLDNGMILHLRDGKAILYDGGDSRVSFTTTETIAFAIVRCLEHVDETRNRGVYIQDIATTQNHIIDIARKVDPAKVWDITHASTLDLERQANEAFERKETDIMSMRGSIFRMYFGGEAYNQPSSKLDNELLGIKGMDDAELEALIRKTMSS